ncbi:carboxypeptidase regulatory-like domain-containing protein [Streptomyces sp. NBC_00448]|uniref:carboxypeptidase regulatory-like domain-containing protein n=1 Tax=Streptomyces sp. NBC_00448 TaxID=2903652 RepID=UPI002E1DED6C
MRIPSLPHDVGGPPPGRTRRRRAAGALGVLLAAALAVAAAGPLGTAEAAAPQPAAPAAAPAATATAAKAPAGKPAGKPSGTTVHTSTAPGSRAPKRTGAVTSSCAAPKAKGVARCFAKRVDGTAAGTGVKAAAVAPSGYGPGDLLSAYHLPADGGRGATIAIVDAYDAPTAAADLAVYRTQFGLPALQPGQFTKVDQRGSQNSYPTPDAGWATEISLDLDMVSAVAPEADILLVEADSASLADLAAAVDEAAALGATYISNSYGGSEDGTEAAFADAHYDHPGVAVVASSGDDGYGVQFPAAAPEVTAVGGTALTKDAGTAKGWTETAWSGAGSGCSAYVPKPSFQTDTGCGNRAVADVSAVADPHTGVAVYDTYGSSGDGWAQYGGTSVAAPVIASVYALAGPIADHGRPNTFPYARPGALNDVTSGSNGTCTTAYLCTAGPGYDGPTGLGTPDGTTAFAATDFGTVAGKVTDEAGAPVGGVRVTATGAASGRTTTRSDGTYSLPLPVGDYTVTAAEFGWTSVSHAATVTTGTTTAGDFVLARRAMVTLSGKVTDASGHGWPLGATLALDDGSEAAPFSSDFYTGAYSVDVPANGSYTLHVASAIPGYTQRDVQVQVGSGNVVHDIGLDAQLLASDGSAPGYTQKTATSATEKFATGTIPAGWSTTSAKGDPWTFHAPDPSSWTADPTLGFASAMSGGDTDSTLVTPATAQPAGKSLLLTFRTVQAGGLASIDSTADGGATWQTVWTGDGTESGAQHAVVPAAGNDRSVRLRFHYTTSAVGWWDIADVSLAQAWLHLDKGTLVAGDVTSARTGRPLDGVAVAVAGTTAGATAAAGAGPGGGSDAFYWLFSPATGHRTVTGSLVYYDQARASVKLAADRVTRVDLALANGEITVSGDLSATVRPHGSATRKLTLTNSGDGPATVRIDQFASDGAASAGTPSAPSGAPASKQAVPLKQGTARPLAEVLAAAARAGHGVGSTKTAAPHGTSAAPAAAQTGAPAPAWTGLPDLPTPSVQGVAGTDQGVVYAGLGAGTEDVTNTFYAYDPSSGAWQRKADAPHAVAAAGSGFVGGKLYVTGGVGPLLTVQPATQVYDPATDSWTEAAPDPYTIAGATAVLDGRIYEVGGLTTDADATAVVAVYDPATDTWSKAADYPENIMNTQCGATGGRLYCAGGVTAGGSTTDAFGYDPAANRWHRVAALPVDAQCATAATANGELVVAGGIVEDGQAASARAFAYDPAADWWAQLPDLPGPQYYGAGATGLYSVGGVTADDSLTGAYRLTGYDQAGPVHLPWLSLSRDTVTVPAGRSVTVTVRLTGDRPGTVAGSLGFESDALHAVAPLPVTLTVAARPTGHPTGR